MRYQQHQNAESSQFVRETHLDEKQKNEKVKLFKPDEWEAVYQQTVKNIINKSLKLIEQVNKKKLPEEQAKKIRHAGKYPFSFLSSFLSSFFPPSFFLSLLSSSSSSSSSPPPPPPPPPPPHYHHHHVLITTTITTPSQRASPSAVCWCGFGAKPRVISSRLTRTQMS